MRNLHKTAGGYSEREREDVIKAMRPNASKEEIKNGIPTFPEFITMIFDKEWHGSKDSHWGPFDKICQPCSIHYDYVLKLETITQDMMPVLDLLASKDKPSEYLASLVVRPSNVSPKTNSSLKKEVGREGMQEVGREGTQEVGIKRRFVIEEMKTLTLAQREKVVKRFEPDMKLYGYGFDIETCEAYVGI